ncbi:MAG: ABC transporter substrate-binding protein [Gemmatimonadetes bacterium]|nr:ABC transporter substrate-binding protein [Gemmatimonadota bacterium]
MIHIGIDDTDLPGTPGTNQLARRFAAALPPGLTLVVALRHQLLFDSRIPYTTKNGCASLLVRGGSGQTARLLPILQRELRAWYQPGSDPGLCVAEEVAPVIVEFGRRCQREIVSREDARLLARKHRVHLEGFGGTEDGVIGALAGVGLLAGGDDGRVVHRNGWQWPDPVSGWLPVAEVLRRGVDEVRDAAGAAVREGEIDIGKHLRPSYRNRRVVLFVELMDDGGAGGRWRALKLP